MDHARLSTPAVQVLPERAAPFHALARHLLMPAGGVSRAQGRLVDGPRAPAARAFVAPPVVEHGLVERFPEVRERCAVLDGFHHRVVEILQQLGLRGARHHERPVVLGT